MEQQDYNHVYGDSGMSVDTRDHDTVRFEADQASDHVSFTLNGDDALRLLSQLKEWAER